MKIANTIAIVTGGGSGLGEATARALSNEGAKVAIFDIDAEKGTSVAKDIGGLFVPADITDDHSLSDGFDMVENQFAGVARILVACAGSGIRVKTVTSKGRHSIDQFRRVIELNLVGTFNCLAHAAERMAATTPLETDERGIAITTSSIAAFDGITGQAAYAASKAGLVGMTLPIARDLAELGIRVVSVAPGLFETPLLTELPEEVRQNLASDTPFPNRLGKPEEFAQMVCGVIENPMLNGTTIRLDGALRMQ